MGQRERVFGEHLTTNQQHTQMAWHTKNSKPSTSSLGLAEASLQTFCLDTYLSELAKSKNTPETSSSSDKKMDVCPSSRSGMMSAPSTEDRGEDQLTFSAGDFHAQTFLQHGPTATSTEDSRGLMETLQACGGSIYDSLQKLNLTLCGLKTPPTCEVKDLTPSSPALTRWGIMRHGVCLGLGTLARTTTAKECGFLPTPTSHNAKEGAYPAEYTRKTPTLSAQVGGRLNPAWIEWRMGWPLGWTQIGGSDSKPSAMAKTLEWQQQHSEFCTNHS